jgi:putative membrane protein
MGWSFDPLQLGPLVLAGLLYSRRAWTLARRGRPVRRARLVSFGAGLLVFALALVSPIDTIGETRLFSVHMAQHLLIGDVAPLLIVLGLSRPLVRPILALPGVWRGRGLAHPLVALPLWAAGLWVWHLPLLYDAALDDDLVHAVEHAAFFTGGLLLWATLLGLLPSRFGSGQRLLGLAFVWVTGAALANVLLWSGRAWYPAYVRAPRTWGLSALADQRAGGGVMLFEMMFVGTIAFVAIGLGWLADAERRQIRGEGSEPVRT